MSEADLNHSLDQLVDKAYTLGFLEGDLKRHPSAQEVEDSKARCRDSLEELSQAMREEMSEFDSDQVIEILSDNIGAF